MIDWWGIATEKRRLTSTPSCDVCGESRDAVERHVLCWHALTYESLYGYGFPEIAAIHYREAIKALGLPYRVGRFDEPFRT